MASTKTKEILYSSIQLHKYEIMIYYFIFSIVPQPLTRIFLLKGICPKYRELNNSSHIQMFTNVLLKNKTKNI